MIYQVRRQEFPIMKNIPTWTSYPSLRKERARNLEISGSGRGSFSTLHFLRVLKKSKRLAVKSK